MKKKLSQVLGILIFYKLEPAKSEFLFSPEDNQLDWTGSLKNKIAAKLLIVTAKLFCNLVEPSNHVIFFSVEVMLVIVRKGKGHWTESNTIRTEQNFMELVSFYRKCQYWSIKS